MWTHTQTPQWEDVSTGTQHAESDHREVWETRVGREVTEVRVGDRPVPAEMPLAHEKMLYGGSWADSGFVPGQSVKSRLVGLCCYPSEL